MGKFRSTIPEKRVEWGQSGRVSAQYGDEDKGGRSSADLSASQFIERGLFTRPLAHSIKRLLRKAPPSGGGLLREIYEDTKGEREREGDKGGTAGSPLTSVPKKTARLSRRIGEQVCERDKFICVCLAC